MQFAMFVATIKLAFAQYALALGLMHATLSASHHVFRAVNLGCRRIIDFSAVAFNQPIDNQSDDYQQ